ncbi:2Fe-2S iron-sulfur cluster-binding protein [Castellaniella sp. UC4442_H9]
MDNSSSLETCTAAGVSPAEGDVPVTLLFSDGVTRRVDGRLGESVISAAARAGLNLLTDCANGECGTCMADLVSGDLELGPHSPLALPEDERAHGAVLTCISRISGPCAIELPYDSSEALAAEEEPTVGRITKIDRVAVETISLEVLVDQPLDFEPGQYVRLRPRGSDTWRSYSMSNPPGARMLRFFVRVVENGVFSTWLTNEAVAGAEIEVGSPRGTFFLRRETKPRLFVSGGTGLAPFLAMLHCIVADPSLQRAPITLLVGARSCEHFFARDEIEAAKAKVPLLKVLFAAEKGGSGSCHVGYATDLIASVGISANDRVYLCGPPPMVEAGRAALRAAGVSGENALAERFI